MSTISVQPRQERLLASFLSEVMWALWRGMALDQPHAFTVDFLDSTTPSTGRDKLCGAKFRGTLSSHYAPNPTQSHNLYPKQRHELSQPINPGHLGLESQCQYVFSCMVTFLSPLWYCYSLHERYHCSCISTTVTTCSLVISDARRNNIWFSKPIILLHRHYHIPKQLSTVVHINYFYLVWIQLVVVKVKLYSDLSTV